MCMGVRGGRGGGGGGGVIYYIIVIFLCDCDIYDICLEVF